MLIIKAKVNARDDEQRDQFEAEQMRGNEEQQFEEDKMRGNEERQHMHKQPRANARDDA